MSRETFSRFGGGEPVDSGKEATFVSPREVATAARATEMARPLVLSASRTRDMVHRTPGLLAEVLSGKRRCRWGPYAPEGVVDPGVLHSVVLWTKAPGNLLAHESLRSVLERLALDHRVNVALQLTVTGLGGSFVEPGIPRWQEVADTTARLLETSWLDPRAITLRFDPFLLLETPCGHRFGNLDPAVFRTVLEPFLRLGIARVVTSRADAVRYPRVLDRVAAVGLRWVAVGERAAESFCRDMDTWCLEQGATFSVCCEPPVPGLSDRWGCIDAGHLNPLVPGRAGATSWSHNRLGKQRPACRCSYSKDIGYTTGAARCFSGGFGCLYCYAQGRARAPGVSKLRAEVLEFDRDPVSFLADRGQHPGLWMNRGGLRG